MKAVFLALTLAVLLTGCQGKAEPLLVYGKPVDHWLGELKKPDPRARKKAIAALGHAGSRDPLALPALIDAVKDRDARVRDEAIRMLVGLGADAKEAIPALTEALKDPDATVREDAARALEHFQNQ